MYATMVKRTKLVICNGDIIDEKDIESICIPMNADAKMAGGVALAIKNRGGKQIEDELRLKKPLTVGYATSTQPGELKFKRIIHGVIMQHVATRTTSEETIYSVIQNALRVCDEERLKSIAFTYFATGFGSWSPQKSANSMLSSAINYIKQGTKIREVRFIAHEQDFGFYQKALLEALYKNLDILYNPAILVVDMIEDFFGEGKIISEEQGKSLCMNINRLLSAARDHNVPIIFLNDSHDNDGDHEFTRTPIHALKGTPGADILADIDYRNERIIEKSRYDGFFNTELEEMLNNLSVTNLIMCGVQSHVCVLLTALSAFYRGIQPVMVADCLGSSSEDKHDLGQWYLLQYGGDVANMSDVKSLFQSFIKNEAKS